MAENKNSNRLTTAPKAPKPSQKRQGEVREKHIVSERMSKHNIEKSKQGGDIFESQGPSKPKK